MKKIPDIPIQGNCFDYLRPTIKIFFFSVVASRNYFQIHNRLHQPTRGQILLRYEPQSHVLPHTRSETATAIRDCYVHRRKARHILSPLHPVLKNAFVASSPPSSSCEYAAVSPHLSPPSVVLSKECHHTLRIPRCPNSAPPRLGTKTDRLARCPVHGSRPALLTRQVREELTRRADAGDKWSARDGRR